AAQTDGDGRASVTATAGTIAGSYTVTAAAAGVTSPAAFALTNTHGAPASVTVASGSGQTATVTTGFATPLVAVVKDAYGNPVPEIGRASCRAAAEVSANLAGSEGQRDGGGRARRTAEDGTI